MPVAVMRRFFLVALVWFLVDSTESLAQRAAGQAGPESATQNAAAVLARAKEVMGSARVGQSVIHCHAVAATVQNYESDRTYPPFFSAMNVNEVWFDPQTGVDRISTLTTYPGTGTFPSQVTLRDAARAFRQAEK